MFVEVTADIIVKVCVGRHPFVVRLRGGLYIVGIPGEFHVLWSSDNDKAVKRIESFFAQTIPRLLRSDVGGQIENGFGKLFRLYPRRAFGRVLE